MRNRVERLRIWLLVSAVVLMVVVAVFIGWARYLRGKVAGLPARLGVNVVREADGYTYSQIVGGRTLYRIHAAKAVEHANGKVALHDVSITVYGKSQERSDRIYGDEFEYDKVAQVVRAPGVVHIDLAAAGAGGEKVTHVTTSGLVFVQKLGLAATKEAIDFSSGGMTGHAVGADYSSDSGMLMLHSAVKMSGTAGGRAIAMTAATAQFDEHSGQATMTLATYQADGKRAEADEATVDRRTDGTLSRIVAKGRVKVVQGGAEMDADGADIALTAESQPKTAVFVGAVRYAAEGEGGQVRGWANEARIAFDGGKKAQAKNAVFVGAVHMTERSRVGAGWRARDLVAGKVEASLAVGPEGRAWVRDVEATGSSRAKEEEDAAAGGRTSELAADDLKAHLVETGKTVQVDTIAGRGHTHLRRVMGDGKEQTVAADALDAKMKPAGEVKSGRGKAGVAGESLGGTLWSSVQQGHVAMTQRVPARVNKKTGAMVGPGVEHALADRAVYDGDAKRMTLSGGVQVSDGESLVWASQIAFDEETGDAHALGGVKVSYAGSMTPGGKARGDAAEPAHVVADRAELEHASGVATFYGKPARLWEGGSQVQAAVIELAKDERRLVARGEGAEVRTVLAGRGSSGGAGPSTGGGGRCESGGLSGGGVKKDGGAGMTRIASGGLTYSGVAGEARFTGGFRAETADGTIKAGEGVAYLLQKGGSSGAAKGADAAAMLSGELDRVVATGGVEMDRPGMMATGKRLVYTAKDGAAVLTGDARTPPKAVGAQGTTTGEELRFRSTCAGSGSVEVVGGSGERVQTDAVISDKKNGMGK